ncbi:ribulose-phosphate 3-epimerase [bacterium BMS3Abin02]|nr:ribulose-phosphate 3-epimerase [bacterium BMS3Abin02]
MQPARIAPSILAADFAHLAEDVAMVEPYVELLHLDVMDGHFVPNITFGIPVIAALRRCSSLFFDCHLMTTNPDAYFPALRTAGVDLATVHIEVYPDPTRVAAQARAEGLAFGLALNPSTPFEAVEPFVELVDLLLVMSVHPGFGGQSFIGDSLEKVEIARKFIDSHSLPTDIEIDGGVSSENARAAREAGADVFVAGSAIFGSADPVAAVQELRASVESME